MRSHDPKPSVSPTTITTTTQVVRVTDADLKDDERQEAEQLAISAKQIEITFAECLELLQSHAEVIDSGGIVRLNHITPHNTTTPTCCQPDAQQEENVDKANELVEQSDGVIAKASKKQNKKVSICSSGFTGNSYEHRSDVEKKEHER